MANVKRDVMPELECPICTSLLAQPKQLSCGHTFCEACLTRILKSPRAESVSCPNCRRDTKLGSDGVSSLPTNFSLKSIVSNITSNARRCSNCNSGEIADCYCSDCKHYLCNDCHEIHSKSKSNSSHVVVNADERKPDKVVPQRMVICQGNWHKLWKSRSQCTEICITCNKFICMRCRNRAHKRGHNVKSIEEYNDSYSRAAESLRVEAEARISIVVERGDINKAERRKLVNQLDEKMKKYDTTHNEKIKSLKEEKQAFDRKCKMDKENICRKFDEMRIKDEQFVESLINAYHQVINSAQTPMDSEVNTVANREAMCEQLRQVLSEDDPSRVSILEVSRQAGILKFEQNNELSGLELGDVQESECTANVAFSTPKEMCCMAATPDGRMAVGGVDAGDDDEEVGGIGIYSADGQLQQKVLNGAQVLGIAFLSDGRCTVRSVFGTNEGIHTDVSLYNQRWEKDGARFEARILCEDDDELFGDLTVDSDDRIYVSNRKAKTIQVFTPAGGAPIREIACDGYLPQQIFAMKTSKIMVVKTHDNAASAMDVSRNQLIELNDVIKKGLVYPAVGKNNTIIIATVNNEFDRVTIERYTSELKRVATLIIDHVIQKPMDPDKCWYYLHEFTSGEIALCTPERLYIFS